MTRPPDAHLQLAELDEDQREAAQALRGPVVIHAGAGAGKTRTITYRIAHGVQTGVFSPDRVLAVTFTRKAAGELQSRLRALGVVGVQARTFHGAALAQLGFFWGQVVGGEAPKILSGKVSTLGQAADAIGIRADQETLRDVASEIEWRKVSMLDLEQYGRLIAERGTVGTLTADQQLELQKKYELLKDERRQIDFEDVLILMTGMIHEEPAVALQVRERYRFFTVDEYQDVSPLQHALLRTWVGERDDVCVVGDGSQTIYSFAGASSSYLHDFSREFPGASTFRLERNYRSAPQIIEVANRLMQSKPGSLKLKPMRATRAPTPTYEWFTDERAEARAVAERVQETMRRGVRASDIALLYRTHGYSMHLENALREVGVSARVLGAERYFNRADIRRAVMEIRAQSVIPDGRPLFQVVSDVIRGQGWTSKPPTGSAHKERWEALGALLRLVDELPKNTGVRAFSDELLRRSKTGDEPTLDAVTLSTIHAAKGLEWSVVGVVGAAESVLPISYATDENAIAEERRLFYVALTRARDELWLSGSAGSGRFKRTPSRFLVEAGVVSASDAPLRS